MYHKICEQHVPFITNDKFSKIAHDLATVPPADKVTNERVQVRLARVHR